MNSQHKVELTPRERDVLALIGRGFTNGQIANELGLSFPTAKWYVSELISKLGVQSREEVAAYWRAERSLSGRWKRLTHAMVGLPMLKIGIGGTTVAGVAGGAAVAVALVGGGPIQDVAVEASPTTMVKLVPTPTPTPDAMSLPPGCPTTAPSPPGIECEHWHYPAFRDADKGGCDLSDGKFGRAYYHHVDLRGCDLSNTRWDGPMANDAHLDGANLDGANIQGGTIAVSSFRGVSLRGAVLVNVQLQASDFTGADLTGATLRNVGLRHVIWSDTICPNGILSSAMGGTCLDSEGVDARPSEELGSTTISP